MFSDTLWKSLLTPILPEVLAFALNAKKLCNDLLFFLFLPYTISETDRQKGHLLMVAC